MKNKVRKYRRIQEQTQQELSQKIGVSRQTIHAIESGRYVPSTILALKLAQNFKLPVEKLFELEAED